MTDVYYDGETPDDEPVARLRCDQCGPLGLYGEDEVDFSIENHEQQYGHSVVAEWIF